MRRGRAERELDEEFRFHLDQATEAGMERGLARDEARRAAMRSLTGIEQRKEECRDAWGVRIIDETTRDVRHALRTLRRSPGFTAIAILSLALGIGANTAVFSLIDALLIRPLPVTQPDRLALLSVGGPGYPRSFQYWFSYPVFQELERRNGVFSGLFAWMTRDVQTPEGREMALLSGVFASGDYFNLLGVRPQIGQTFGPCDDDPAGGKKGAVAVISDRFWQRKYARRPEAIGSSIVINGVPMTIVGAMPPGFFGAEVGTAPDIWMPLNLARRTDNNAQCFDRSNCVFLSVMGRLRPGVTEPQAQADLRVISRPIMEATFYRGISSDKKAEYLARTLTAESGKAGFTRLRLRVRNPLAILMALVGLVLLIACVNMANLLTARPSARFREVGVRFAMGADRFRVVRHFLTESLVLAFGGAAAGFLFAVWSTRALIRIFSTAEAPLALDLHPDWRVLVFGSAVAIASGMLFGITPALNITRHGPSGALKHGARNLRGGEERLGFRRALLTLQVTLSVVLLSAAGLFAGTLLRLMHVDTGFDPNGLTMISVMNSRPTVPEAREIEIFGRLMRRARTIPGVQSATFIWPPPLSNNLSDDVFEIQARTNLPEDQRLAYVALIGTQFTQTMRIPLLTGRDFNDRDTAESEKVALITRNAAQGWFPQGKALGGRVRPGFGKDWLRIVGITADYRYLNLRDDPPLTVFLPITQRGSSGDIVLRTALPVNATLTAFRSMLREEAPAMPVAGIKTMRQQMEESLSTERLTAYLSVFIGALALLLTSFGLYGLLAYAVARRTGEIGIRIALGAKPGSVLSLVMRQTLAHVATGAAAGVAAAFACSRIVRSLLNDVRPNDPATIGAALAVLVVVCATAASLPARRASRLDPMRALREE